MNKAEAEALGLKVITLNNESMHKENYKHIAVNYIKGDDNLFYAVSAEKGVKFCMSAVSLEDVQTAARKAIDFYWSKDWDGVENLKKRLV
jgi:hypothetical protein